MNCFRVFSKKPRAATKSTSHAFLRQRASNGLPPPDSTRTGQGTESDRLNQPQSIAENQYGLQDGKDNKSKDGERRRPKKSSYHADPPTPPVAMKVNEPGEGSQNIISGTETLRITLESARIRPVTKEPSNRPGTPLPIQVPEPEILTASPAELAMLNAYVLDILPAPKNVEHKCPDLPKMPLARVVKIFIPTRQGCLERDFDAESSSVDIRNSSRASSIKSEDSDMFEAQAVGRGNRSRPLRGRIDPGSEYNIIGETLANQLGPGRLDRTRAVRVTGVGKKSVASLGHQLIRFRVTEDNIKCEISFQVLRDDDFPSDYDCFLNRRFRQDTLRYRIEAGDTDLTLRIRSSRG